MILMCFDILTFCLKDVQVKVLLRIYNLFRSLIEQKSTNRIDETSSGVGTDITICPTHNLISNSENASDASDENDYQHHHDYHHHHHHHHSHNLSSKSINIQAAVIHVIGDFIQSIGVFTSAIIIKFYVSHPVLKCHYYFRSI